MVPALTIIGIAAVLVVGGTVVSLFLYTLSFSRVSSSRGVRRLQMATIRHEAGHPFLANVSMVDSELTQYARRALVALIFALVLLALAAISVLHAFLH